MTPTEAAKLLAILSAVDRREFDATTAQGWAWALDDIPYDYALQAARKAYKAGKGFVDIPAIEREINTMRPSMEADVRAAKARGIIPADWPKTRPLPDAERARLIEARKELFEGNNDYPDEIADGGPRKQIR